jgi:hypothetical protein
MSVKPLVFLFFLVECNRFVFTNKRELCYKEGWQVDSEGFWRWCITLRFTGFLDFFHRPVFWKLENTTFRKLDLFPSSGVGGKTPTQLGPLDRDSLNHWTTPVIFTQLIRCLPSPIPEDGKRSVSETSCFLVPRIPDDGKSPKTQYF